MQCPNCSKEIRDTAKVCGYCGNKINTSPESCPNCGKEVREGAKVCGYCGFKLLAAVPAAKPSSPAPPAPKKTAPPPHPKKSQKQALSKKPEEKQKVQPVPKQKATAKPELASKPVESIQDKQPGKKKGIPVWIWGITGLLVVGLIAVFLFYPSKDLPDPVKEINPNAKTVQVEEFNSTSSQSFRSQNISIDNGIARIAGNGVQYDNYILFDGPFSVGDGILALFKIEPEADNTQWWLVDLYSDYGAGEVASVGFSEWYHPYVNIAGEGSDTNFTGMRTQPKAGVWYFVLFAITDRDEISVRIWEQANPTRLSEHTWRLGSDLAGRSWKAGFFAHVGDLYLDSVQILSISK